MIIFVACSLHTIVHGKIKHYALNIKMDEASTFHVF
jgi:hypothetical protein